MTKTIFLALTLGAFSLAAVAQETSNDEKDRLYVTDQLWLSIYENANERSTRLGQFRSGDMLIIDEISGPYALVTGPDGERGWVKRGFLNAEPTNNILLAQEQEKNASLSEEIEKLGNSKTVLETYEKDMDAMAEKITVLEADKVEASNTIASLEQQVVAVQEKLDRKLQNNLPPYIVLLDTLKAYWKYILPIALVLILVSFLVSKAIVEAHIKSKFHGIKIW